MKVRYLKLGLTLGCPLNTVPRLAVLEDDYGRYDRSRSKVVGAHLVLVSVLFSEIPCPAHTIMSENTGLSPVLVPSKIGSSELNRT